MLLMRRLLLQNNLKLHQYKANSGIFAPEDMADSYKIKDFSQYAKIGTLVTQYQGELEDMLGVAVVDNQLKDAYFTIVSSSY